MLAAAAAAAPQQRQPVGGSGARGGGAAWTASGARRRAAVTAAARGCGVCSWRAPNGELLSFRLGELLTAEDLARLLDAHLELVVRVHDLVATQHLAEVFGDSLHHIRLAEGQPIVLKRQPVRRASTHREINTASTKIERRRWLFRQGRSSVLRFRRGQLVDLQLHFFSRHVVVRCHARQIEAGSQARELQHEECRRQLQTAASTHFSQARSVRER